MPKVYLTKQDEMSEKLVALIYGRMKVRNVTQKKMADRMGISQQAYGKKLKNRQFTYWDLVIIFDELDIDDQQMIQVMRGRRSNNV